MQLALLRGGSVSTLLNSTILTSKLLAPLFINGQVGDVPLLSLSFTGSGLPDDVTFERSSAALGRDSSENLYLTTSGEARLRSDLGVRVEESRTTSRCGQLDGNSSAFPLNVVITQDEDDPTGGTAASKAMVASTGDTLTLASTTYFGSSYSSGSVSHAAYVRPVGDLRYIQCFGDSGTTWYINFDLSGSGTITASSSGVSNTGIIPCADGGYIIYYDLTATREAYMRFVLLDDGAAGRAGSASLQTTDGLLVYASNAVNAAGFTSLIPGNTSASSTRSRDNVSFSPTSIPINSGRIEIQARTALFLGAEEQTLVHIGNSGTNWHIRRDPSGKFTAWMGSASADISTSTFADDTDITLIWEWDGTSHKFTINGEATTVTGSAIDAPITTAVLGRHYGNNNEFWNGYIKSVKIYGG